MNITDRKPFTPGEILAEEFLEPYQLTQDELAQLPITPTFYQSY